jgi:predicted ribosomally synthesized peptide with nif11-like leader
MSQENIVKFQEKLMESPELRQKLKAVRAPEDIIAVAKAEGFDFTAEDYSEHVKTMAQNSKDSKIPDDELDKVAGGMTDGNGRWLTMFYYNCNLYTAAPGAEDHNQCGTCKYWEFKSASSTGEIGHGISLPMELGVPGTCYANH